MNPDIEKKFNRLIEEGAQRGGLPNYDKDAIDQNDAPYYTMNLPDYDFSELGIVGLQSLFMNLTAKLGNLEDEIKLEQDYHKRVRFINERAILKKTIMAVETSLVDRKRKEVLEYLEAQRKADEDRAGRLKQVLAQDEADYNKQRNAREKDIAMMKEAELNKLRVILGSEKAKSKKDISEETDRQLKRATSIKKRAEKIADDKETKAIISKAGAKSGKFY